TRVAALCPKQSTSRRESPISISLHAAGQLVLPPPASRRAAPPPPLLHPPARMQSRDLTTGEAGSGSSEPGPPQPYSGSKRVRWWPERGLRLGGRDDCRSEAKDGVTARPPDPGAAGAGPSLHPWQPPFPLLPPHLFRRRRCG
ncbi:unnamed protein product, partial [Urochloa humidicola]